MIRLNEFLINSKSTGIIKCSTLRFVDLDLSVLWADRNIGAKEDIDPGNYYLWGGLEAINNNDDASWKNTPFNNGMENYDFEYFLSIKNKVCPYDKLSKEYDVAYQTYKDNVHTPTIEQIIELIKFTKSEWVSNYQNSNVNGTLFTGKNDNSIFIPAAGFLTDYKYAINMFNEETVIWSSSIHKGKNNIAYTLRGVMIEITDDQCSRCVANNIRAVKEK